MENCGNANSSLTYLLVLLAVITALKVTCSYIKQHMKAGGSIRESIMSSIHIINISMTATATYISNKHIGWLAIIMNKQIQTFIPCRKQLFTP